MTDARISRRRFIIDSTATVAGLAIGFELPNVTQHASAGTPNDPSAPLASPEIGVWVVIEPNEDVVFRIVKSEMGQGTITGLAQMIAEELECDWQKVSYEYPTPGESKKRNHVWGSYSTGGSHGIRQSERYVRQGGAAARMMLIQSAATRWGVPTHECFARNSVIFHSASGRSTTYGAVSSAASKLPVPIDVVLKDPKDWQLIGKPVHRIDNMPGKVTGGQIYGIDLKLPEMLIATINECPVFGGAVRRFDATEAMQINGVKKVVKVGDTAVAVIADTFWHAKTALEKVKIDWDFGANANVDSPAIKAFIEEGLGSQFAFVRTEAGNIKSAIAGAAKTLESTYFFPFLNHATLEPMNATARWTPERCEAWVPTQNGDNTLAAVIRASGLPAEQCDVYKLNIGGGFGRRGSHQDYTVQAVLIAKQFPGSPIKLIWTREEDMTQGRYHPVMMGRLTGTFDDRKNVTGLHIRLSGQSIRAATHPAKLAENGGMDPEVFQGLHGEGENAFGYQFPNLLIDHAMRNTHVPPGFWRGVNVNQNAVFLETFIDEMADYAGADPLAFRLAHLSNSPRTRAVLEAVADRIGWSKQAPSDLYRGIAQMKSYGSFAAAACELSVSDASQVKIHKIVAAIDPGYAVNPAQIERQVSGSILYGLSALFQEQITIREGRVEQRNFFDFDSLRLAQMPRVETLILQGGGEEWGGVGEPAMAVASPAVLNAIFRATGRRIRTVPLANSGFELV
ncbi:molybdopterin cofactor-binding domain-containing protein [Aestuariivirga sp.]|uniref:xanthine dehydrogenase family protein molybdopterin-binding subunit n=1 Tax=Aestuariivirga sp. TaxID=2650926 RepID=UPI003BA9F577